MTHEQFILKQLENGVVKSDDQLLEAFTKKYIKFWWKTGAKFRLQCSFWRIVKDMRQRGKIDDITREKHKCKNSNADYHIIYYKLIDGQTTKK